MTGLDTTRPHILVVTDHHDLAQFLQEGLLYGGFWVSVVASAIQTLEIFRLRMFDLVVIDGGLASLGGNEMIRRLRQRTDVPIVFIDGETRVPGSDGIGADHVIRPPLELGDVVPLLHSMVAQWRREHPGRPSADEAAHHGTVVGDGAGTGNAPLVD